MKVFHGKILKYQLKDTLLYWIYIPAAVIGGGILVDLALGLSRFGRHTIISALAALLLVAGAAMIFRSMRDLEVLGHGTVNPKSPPKRLVTSGSYALCRHPMFLGYDLAALGVLLLIGSPGTLFAAYPVMILLEWRFLRREEQKLERRFGDQYRSYRDRTPFLLPFTKGHAARSDRPKESH